MNEAFPKTSRLTTQKDFDYMKTDSARMRDESVLMVYKKSRIENLQTNRIGLIVSKKNGNAVRRNRIKRTLRELFRKSDLRNFKNHFDLLLIINMPREKNIDEVGESLTQSFQSLSKRFMKKHAE